MVNRLTQPPQTLTPVVEPLAPACTDGELLMRFRRHGDQGAFAQVVERHGPMIWGVCTRVLVRRADAEDAYQATLLILMKKAHTIRENESAGGWLFRVAHNAALAALRRRKALRETPLENTPLEPEQAFPDLEQKQLVGALLEELRSMPAKYQKPLVLRYLEGRSRREIAEAMDATVAVVAGQLVRGRRMLRSRLARRGVSLGLALGAFGVGSASHAAAATIHGGPPALDPAALSSTLSTTASSAAQQLAQQGIRSMLYASATKPVTLGLAASLAVALLLVDPQDGAAQSEPNTALALQATIDEPADEPQTAAPVRFAKQTGARPTSTVAAAKHFLFKGKDRSQHVSVKSDSGLVMHTENGKTIVRLPGEEGEKGTLRVTLDNGEKKEIELAFNKSVDLNELVGESLNLHLPSFGEPVNAPQPEVASVSSAAPTRPIAPFAVAVKPAPASEQEAGMPVEGVSDFVRRKPQSDQIEQYRQELARRQLEIRVLEERLKKLNQELKRKGATLEGAAPITLPNPPQAPVTPSVRASKPAALAPPNAPAVVNFAAGNRAPSLGMPVEPRLKPGDRFRFYTTNNLVGGPIDCVIEPSGTIGLGPEFGRVKIVGKTLIEAEEAIQKKLREEWPDIKVQLTPAVREIDPFSVGGPPSARAPWSSYSRPTPVAKKPKGGAIEAGERLVVEIVERIGDIQMLNDTMSVDGDGDLALGAQWGRFQVRGLKLREAEDMIRQQAQSLAAKAWMVREHAEGRKVAAEAPIDVAVQVTRETAPEPPTVKATFGGFGGGYGGFGGGGGGFGGEFGGGATNNKPTKTKPAANKPRQR